MLATALAEEARFLVAVEQGFAELDAGQFVFHEEVGRRIERRFRSVHSVRWAPKAATDLEWIFHYLDQSMGGCVCSPRCTRLIDPCCFRIEG